VHSEIEANAPFITDHPRLTLALASTAALGGTYLYRRHTRARGIERAAALIAPVSGACERVASWGLLLEWQQVQDSLDK
jgi:hypothetical protein